MSILSEHPQKQAIDVLIMSNSFSYRELQSELEKRFGVKISYKSIQQYHTKELGGAVTVGDGDGGSGDGSNCVPIDNEKLEELVLELTKKYGESPIKKHTAKLYAIQMQITEHALLEHTKGLSRYPSEYVKNLQILSNLLMKK